MDTTTSFAGDKKVGASILEKPEKKLVRTLVPRVPLGLETYHLTMLTVLWSALAIGFAFLARWNLWWLTGVSVMIALQYITDLLDGAVGRERNTGLVKWGFFMDHLLDFVFNGVVVICFAIIAPQGLSIYFLLLLLMVGTLMVNSFLSFAATNRFEIYFLGMGPTEFRCFLIAVLTMVSVLGVGHFYIFVPISCAITFLGLVAMTWRNHRVLWEIDMAAKAEQSASSQAAQCSAPGIGHSLSINTNA